jgi:hypothetical protein
MNEERDRLAIKRHLDVISNAANEINRIGDAAGGRAGQKTWDFRDQVADLVSDLESYLTIDEDDDET